MLDHLRILYAILKTSILEVIESWSQSLPSSCLSWMWREAIHHQEWIALERDRETIVWLCWDRLIEDAAACEVYLLVSSFCSELKCCRICSDIADLHCYTVLRYLTLSYKQFLSRDFLLMQCSARCRKNLYVLSYNTLCLKVRWTRNWLRLSLVTISATVVSQS